MSEEYSFGNIEDQEAHLELTQDKELRRLKHEVTMKTETDLKNKCTPEFIKWMVELAERFECTEFELKTSYQIRYNSIALPYQDILMFPLLIHRAVEGWNKNNKGNPYIEIDDSSIWVCSYNNNFKEFGFSFHEYQPRSLTQAECAMLDCLLDIFKEEDK